MSKPQQVTDTNSFRIPNSIVQGLTTTTTADLNKLSAFETVMLLGLLSQVSSKHPEKEVRTTLSKILQIIEVSRRVTHAVEREWETVDGEVRQIEYEYQRHSPKHFHLANQALLTLHQKSVTVQKRKGETKFASCTVHILDSFGYVYEWNGQTLDVDDLPSDAERHNVGSTERPVWRVRLPKEDGETYDRPRGVLFRLNTELADELSKTRNKDSIGFTLVAGKVFGLLREFMRQPWAIRLILLILRQTGTSFTRKYDQMLQDLGLDQSHPARAAVQLATALARLQELGLITGFNIDLEADRAQFEVNREWYRQAETAIERQGT